MDEIVKRRPGRPPKSEPKAEPKVALKGLKAGANWENAEPTDETSVDRFALPKWFLEKHGKDWSFQWVTHTVLGQEEPQHRGGFEKGGWTPLHQEDFDGDLDGLFMKKGATQEINVGGQVLMARPKELTDRARSKEKRDALEQVMIKEQAWRAGDIPVTLDAQHPTAVQTNRINKTYERIEIPED